MEGFLVGRTGLRYVVLAERNVKNLKEGVADLWKSWTSLRRSKRWKGKVKGCIVALEVTYNREEGTWHPHLNVLMEGEYFPFEELNQAWIKASEGRGQTSFIRAADEGTVRELIKYVTKVSDLLEEPRALDEFLSAVKSARLIRTYGTFFGIPTSDEEHPGVECPDCQSQCVVRLGFVHPHQVSFDFEKEVMRVNRSPGVIASELRDAERFYPSLTLPDRFGKHSFAERQLEHFRKVFAATSRIGEHHNGYSTGTTSPGS